MYIGIYTRIRCRCSLIKYKITEHLSITNCLFNILY